LAPQPEVQSAIYTFCGSEKKSIYNWKFPTTILKGFQCTQQLKLPSKDPELGDNLHYLNGSA